MLADDVAARDPNEIRMNAEVRDALSRLENASLDDLKADAPEAWQQVGSALVKATEGGPASLSSFVTSEREAEKLARARLERKASIQEVKSALSRITSARMARLAADQVLRAAAAHAATGGQQNAPMRFSLWSGKLINALLFSKGLDRKPVSMRTYRFLWPLIFQRRLLMPLVQPRGIYCFYSQELVSALARMFEGMPTLEIAAGDGTLTRFLKNKGTDVRATDDHTWSHAITYANDVEKIDAIEALNRHRPRAVICSFPPPNNAFEKRVFRTSSVEIYVVITTKHRVAAGDWAAYEEQTLFSWKPDPTLAALVLPPEVEPEVLVFRRIG